MTEARVWRVVAVLFGLAVAVFFLFKVWGVLIPFVFGFAIAYLMNPLVDRFVGLGLRRDRVVLVLYLLLFGSAILFLSWMIPILVREASTAIREIPSYASAINALVDKANIRGQGILQTFTGHRVKEFAIPFRADRFIEGLLLGLPAHVLDVAHVALWIVIVPFVAFFGLSQGKNWIDFLFDWTPSNHVEGLLGLLAEINAKLGGYFRGVMVESMGVGLLTMAGLGLMDIQGAVLLGCLSGVLNVIPFLAPVVGGGIALLAAYFQGKALSVLLGIILLYAVVRLFDDVILVPFIIGPSVQLHPVVVVFAVLAGVEVGGFLGLIFAVPAAVVIKVFLSLILRQRRESILLGQPHIYS